MVEGAYVCSDRFFAALRMTGAEVLGYEVDAGIDGDAAEHNEGGETALVEGEVADSEDQKQPDERNRDQENDCQREAKGVEVYGADDEDQCDDKQDKPGIFLLI